MSLLYQKGGKLPEDISTVKNRTSLEDTDYYFKELDNSSPEEEYQMFLKYNKLKTFPVDPKETDFTIRKAGKNTTTSPHLPYSINLRKDLPFENEFEWMQYRDYLHEKELSGRSDKDSLKLFNPGGYVGAYQLGVAALQEANMLKEDPSGKGQKNIIMNASNWKGGAKARDSFLSDIKIQEEALKKYTAKNFKYIRSTLLNNNITDKEDIMGYLAGTHLAGQKNVRKYIKNNGSDFKDGNNTTIDTYVNGFKKWVKDQYVDGQGERRYFDKKGARDILKQKGILINTEDYFPMFRRTPR